MLTAVYLGQQISDVEDAATQICVSRSLGLGEDEIAEDLFRQGFSVATVAAARERANRICPSRTIVVTEPTVIEPAPAPTPSSTTSPVRGNMGFLVVGGIALAALGVTLWITR